MLAEIRAHLNGAGMRKGFVKAGGWLAVVKIVADSMGCNEATVRRILADYVHAAPLSVEAIAAMEEVGIDPAAKPSKPLPTSGTFAVVPPTPEERRRLDVRSALQAALADVPEDKKLEELQAVIEEAMFELLDQLEPITITFTPHPSTPAVRKGQGLEQAASAIFEWSWRSPLPHGAWWRKSSGTYGG
jgi:hypothetical protein